MAYYQVMLEGKDFLIEVDGVSEPTGFVTTRWVKAGNPEDAELIAVDLIRNDKSLTAITKSSEALNPMIYLEEMCIVNWFGYMRRRPGAGYSFYKQCAELESEN